MNYTDYLKRWRQAGLIDESTVAAIHAFETRDAAVEKDDRPSLVEAILYLGIVVVAVGVFSLLAENWEELQSPARIAAVAVPGLLAIVLGFALRATGDRPFVRGGHVAWMLAVVFAFGTTLVAFHEWGSSDDERNGLLAGGFIALSLALALWAASGSVPQILALAGAIFAFGQSLGAWPDDYSTAIAGTSALIGGGIAVALTEFGVFSHRRVAAPIFALVLAAGAYESGIDGSLAWAETMAFITAAILMGLGLVRSNFGYLSVGVGLAFLSLVTLMFEYFESNLGAHVALIISGALLVASVLALIPLRRVLAARHHG